MTNGDPHKLRFDKQMSGGHIALKMLVLDY